ncbi:MAG: thioredoxin family protein [Deltaproteobacteria bacterium]|nr:MAG: thioredoxin family protein [Deltaproteobacteria bacterium]
MRIDILCKPESESRGERVLDNVREALAQLGVEAEVHLYRDRRKMIDHRVYVAPALMLDDVVRVAGRVPAVDEIKGFIVERPRYVHRFSKVA